MRQVAASFAALLSVIAAQYGYYVGDALGLVGARVLHAATGVQCIAFAATVAWLTLGRVTDWRAAFLLLIAAILALLEAIMTAVGGAWYAFFYSGPPIKGDLLEAMTGVSIARPFMAGVALWLSLYLLSSWLRRGGDAYDPHGYFEAWVRPSRHPWRLFALLFAYPFAGRRWIVLGQGYKFDRACGGIVEFEIGDVSRYRLVRLRRPPRVWVGRQWRLLGPNCVLGAR